MIIICNGMLRSGSTLQYNAVCEIVEKTNRGKREGYYELREFEAFSEQFEKWKKDNIYHVIKTHEWLPIEESSNYAVKYFYVWRDPIEVANSARKKFGSSISECISSIKLSLRIKNRLEDNDNALIQDYTNLIDKDSNWITDIANHLNIELDGNEVNEVFEKVQLESTNDMVKKLEKSSYNNFLTWLETTGLKKRIGQILQLFGLSEKYFLRIRRYTHTYDSKTLYHRNHVTKSNYEPLTDSEKKKIIKHFPAIYQ